MRALRRLFGLDDRRMLTPHEAYALWADTYPPQPHNPLMESEQGVVAPILDSIAATRALDIGTGTGRNLPLLQATGARRVVGVDLSMAMLSRNTQQAARVCGDACRLPFPTGAFDLVCSSLMAGDIEHVGSWIDEAARILSPGGHLVYSDFHPAGTANGWRRTFRTARGELCELLHWPHAIDEHLAALADASLAVRTIREPRVDGHAHPVIAVFHAVKHGSAVSLRC